jgi:hypothetical protein
VKSKLEREILSSGTLQLFCEFYIVDIGKLLLFPADLTIDIVKGTIRLLTNCCHWPADVTTEL